MGLVIMGKSSTLGHTKNKWQPSELRTSSTKMPKKSMTMQWWFAGSEDHVYVLAVVTPRRSESSKHERLEWERWLWLHFESCFGKSKPLTQGACYCSQQRVYRSSEFSGWVRLRPNKLLCVHFSMFNSPHHSPNPNLGNGTKTNVSSGTKTLCHECLWNPGWFE